MSEILTPDENATMLRHDAGALDPLADAERGETKNRAKVGSARPSSLLYTYGPGAVMDLPGFSVMPAGLDDWEPILKRREKPRSIEEPRLLAAVRKQLGSQVVSLRPYPWQPKRLGLVTEGSDLGVPARIFPQWFRCTGCDYLGPLSRFAYVNTNPYRPDQARVVHQGCPGRAKRSRRKPSESPAVPAQHLLTCVNGHLDEFPYGLWVHRGKPCPKAEFPSLRMFDANVGSNVGSLIRCDACGGHRGMSEAQGAVGREKLPQTCRGRHPHLDAYDRSCDAAPALIMMGASNLWFASTQSVVVMPRTEAEQEQALADRLLSALGAARLAKYVGQIGFLRDLASDDPSWLDGVTDVELTHALALALAPDSEPSPEEDPANAATWDPVELLVPEWKYLQDPKRFGQQDHSSGLQVTEMPRDPGLRPQISRVVAVNRMKKVNAFLGFTRLDEVERVGDLQARLVKLTRGQPPKWVPATEDRGEGVFLQLDLGAVAAWEEQILGTPVWVAHRDAHRRNVARRVSETAAEIDLDDRLPAPRYWLLHTFAHALIRQMALSSGYGAASLSERIYAWPATPEREAAAGLLICTTASDSDGTLGGLVALAEPERLEYLVRTALRRAVRCPSDPICASRTPRDPEDFLHGAACHCCTFASETSCEKANRFLDRRFLLDLPAAHGETVPGFFGHVEPV